KTLDSPARTSPTTQPSESEIATTSVGNRPPTPNRNSCQALPFHRAMIGGAGATPNPPATHRFPDDVPEIPLRAAPMFSGTGGGGVGTTCQLAHVVAFGPSSA